MAAGGSILVVNAGSSSIKVAVFDDGLRATLSGAVTGIGGRGEIRLGTDTRAADLPDHTAALAALLEALAGQGITLADLRAAAHRVVHGGASLTRPHQVTPEIREAIAACAPLAPLHNPHNLAAIDAIAELAPDLPQCASFDTAFHAGNPALATRYALPDIEATRGIRRYGFHGISYAAMVRGWTDVTGTALPHRLLALHLGNGASICAIRDGRSVATTMGYSPLEGVTMGTRTGSIDGNAVLHLAETLGIEAARHMLNHKSGLLGLSGLSHDMRTLEQADSAAARFAIDHFCYWAARHSGSMIAAMEGLDAIAFTGGIGENAGAVRDSITVRLAWAGDVPVHVVPAQEERRIASDAAALLDGTA
ncbi:acetate kinase [Cribrihabitans marinus]|uniref:Acetate kinase n=1 Tax=Cribrihabitans marinus TaxID=1227549 RepID=A0A1H7C0X4_9RHOB|nr:acetate/propionate family kinase [Cribrihabitans marinus]GGH33837.1 acetate kinase [Cribrihabitans marinus]SEJ80260.1 acetate kinase [Cribrihabitans marinus]